MPKGGMATPSSIGRAAVLCNDACLYRTYAALDALFDGFSCAGEGYGKPVCLSHWLPGRGRWRAVVRVDKAAAAHAAGRRRLLR